MTDAIVRLPVVSVEKGKAVTLSTDVASFFGKRHNDVIRSIETITATMPEDRLRNFAQTVVTRANPSGGAPIQSKAYRLTRDGFTFLAMGFTGEKAQAFKWAYIDAFNRMEQEIQSVRRDAYQKALEEFRLLKNEKQKASQAGKALVEWRRKKDALTLRVETAFQTLQLELPLALKE